jgi:hypothetical protein
LARNRRSPKRPSEPRLSGVRPEEDEVGDMRSLVNYTVGTRAAVPTSWTLNYTGRHSFCNRGLQEIDKMPAGTTTVYSVECPDWSEPKKGIHHSGVNSG